MIHLWHKRKMCLSSKAAFFVILGYMIELYALVSTQPYGSNNRSNFVD